jgi:hypothetical protein
MSVDAQGPLRVYRGPARMSQGWTRAGRARLTLEGASWRPWPRNEAPVRFFHMVPQHQAATKAIFSLAVLILDAINAVSI